MCETNIESFVGFYATNFFYMSAKSLTQFDTFMKQYESHLGPKTGRKLRKVTNIHDAKWQSSWAQDGDASWFSSDYRIWQPGEQNP